MTFDFSSTWNLIKRGEISALKSLFMEISPSLIKYSLQITRDRYIAEEVVQDVFVNIWNNRDQIQIKGSVKSYLYQAIHNLSVNKQIQHNTQRHALNVLVSEESWQYLEDHYHTDEFVIEKLEADDTEKLINSIIEDLPEQSREIFKLSRYHHLSNNEIASHLNISVSTVKTQIYRALEKIKPQLFKDFQK